MTRPARWTELKHEPNCIVVYRRRARDWFAKSYWAVCIYCDDRWGPFPDAAAAWRKANELNDDAARAHAATVAKGRYA